MQEHGEELSVLARAQAFPLWVAWGTALHGWVLAVQARKAIGIAQMWEALAACRTTGLELNRPWILALIAEAYAQTGQAEEGLAALVEALALADKTTERWSAAELYRLKGELLLVQASTRHRGEKVEGCFLEALSIARRQQAKSLELRAAMSLSRLRQRQAKHQAAQQLLAEIYGWFTEGFDTPDLQEARALLVALA